jgi:hypothetical protein
MVNRPRDFRHHDVVRALRAARAAGVENPSVRIRVPSGTEYYVSGGEVVAPAKKSKPLRADLAEGGGLKMMGKGDRTVAAPSEQAGPQQPGSTAHKTGSGGGKYAAGGKVRREGAGGLARPAKGGQCGPD